MDEAILIDRIDKLTAVTMRLDDRVTSVEQEQRTFRSSVDQLTGAVGQFDARLNDLRQDVMGRFTQVESRFTRIDGRFDRLEQRQELMQSTLDQLTGEVRQIDKRFGDIDKRFGDIDKRFGDIDKRLGMMQWMFGILFTLMVIIMAGISFPLIRFVLMMTKTP